MSKVLAWIKKEILHILPAVLYFFLSANLFYLTFGWMLKAEGIALANFSRTIIGALIIGKVMLIVDSIPALNMFSNRPLIYNTIWKTTVYFFFTFIFRVIEHLAPLIMKYKDIGIAWQNLLGRIWWPRFWTVQIWFAVLLLLFVVSTELIKGVGADKIRKMFFGE